SELTEGDLPAHRARVSGARPRPAALAGLRPPPDDRASAADSRRAPDPHVAGRSTVARAPGAPRRISGHTGARRPGVPGEAPGGHGLGLQGSRARAPEPAAHPRGAPARAVRGASGHDARAPLSAPARRLVEEP